MVTSQSSREDRFVSAVAAVRELGVVWFQGAGACCYGCTDLSTVGIRDGVTYLADILIEQEGTDPSWEWVGDDLVRSVIPEAEEDETDEEEGVEVCDFARGFGGGSSLFERDVETLSSLNLHHGGDLALIAQAVAVFVDAGFRVDWDGTAWQTITVHL